MSRGPHHPGRAVAAAAVLSAAALVAGCTSGGGPQAGSSSGTGAPLVLPTTVGRTGLICGFVSRSSVGTVLGRSDLAVTGGLTPAASPNPDGTTFSRAHCSVTTPGYPKGQALPFEIDVAPIAITDLGIVQTARSDADHGVGVVYPADVGTGFASEEPLTAHGTTFSSITSGLVRGNWTLTLGTTTAVATTGADGRDPLSDAVAVMQEVVSTLKIPLRPSTAYPKPFTDADPQLPSPAR